MTSIEKKQIQKERMQKYFIDATKELIVEEGLKNVTTKKIGNRAGYSYATIYNYFENFNELICICITEFVLEMATYVKNKVSKTKTDQNKITTLTLISLNYCLENINITTLFFSNAIDYSYLKTMGNSRFIHPVYTLLIEVIKESKEFSHLSSEEMLNLANMIFFLFHSKLYFYVTLKDPKEKKVLENEILENLNFLINAIIKK